jgi:hypothetical protein
MEPRIDSEESITPGWAPLKVYKNGLKERERTELVPQSNDLI